MTTLPLSNVASGTTPTASKWATLGFNSRAMTYPLTRMFGLMVGEQNCGKTYVLQSCPDAFIINCDLSGSPNPNAVSVSWPGISTEGNPIDIGGRPFVLTWDEVEKKIEQLVAMARNNEPRPAMVVFDTIAGMIRLLQPWVATLLGRSSFNDCDGRQAWDRLYAHMIDRVAMRLRSAGYGVWFVAHLGREWVKIDDAKATETIDFIIGSGLRSRLSAVVEVIVPIVATTSTVPVTVLQAAKGPGGQTINRPIHTTETRITRRFAFSDPKYATIKRARTPKPLPDIDFTGDVSPWDALSRSYDEARGLVPSAQ